MRGPGELGVSAEALSAEVGVWVVLALVAVEVVDRRVEHGCIDMFLAGCDSPIVHMWWWSFSAPV